MIQPPNLYYYTYFISVNTEMDNKARASKKILGQLLGTSFGGETYKPHITAYHYAREENDDAVKRQALPVLQSIRAEALLIKEVEHFYNSNAIVYTFQNPEWITNLNMQLCIAHRKTNKIGKAHLTIARGLQSKIDPSICRLLPSLTGYSFTCPTIDIAKNKKGGPYETFFSFPLI